MPFSTFCSRLLHEKTARGDARGALDRVERCVEIYERYPGLHRFYMGAHKTHIMIVLLVAIATPRAQELYHRMRTVFNLARPLGFLEVPYWEEWGGVITVCDKEACRSVEALLAGEEKASAFFPPPLLSATDEKQLAGAPSTNSERNRNNASASLDPNHSARQAGQMVPTSANDGSQPRVRADPPPIGDCRGSVCVGHVATELLAQGAGASKQSLGPIQALNNEAEEEQVAPEDWFEAVHAMGVR